MSNSFRLNRASVEKIEITNYNNTKTVDLKYMLEEFNLHEDFMQMTLYGNVTLLDSIDLAQELPIIGEETIRVVFSFQSSEEDVAGTKIKKEFRTYKVSDMIRGKNDKAQAYNVHFVSPEYYKNLSVSVENAYTNRTISESARKLYNDYIKTDSRKIFDVEPTKTKQSIIVPGLYPFQAMSMLTRRAWSTQNKSSNYIFFEDRDGFHFRTVESYLDGDVKQTYYYRQAAGVTTSKGMVENKIDIDPFIIRNLSIIQMRDNLKHLIDGMYNTRIDTIDLIAKKYDNRSYDYKTQFNKLKHLEKYPLATEENNLFNSDNVYMPTEKYASSKSYVKNNGGVSPKEWENFIPERKSAFAQLDTIVLEVTIPGDHNRKPGDVIRFNLPSATDLEELQGNHKYLSGKYLVTRVRHKINRDTYSTVMQIVKESTPKKIRPLEA